jgi:purine catabolism regulator
MEATSPISPPSRPELSGVAVAFNATDQLGRHRAHRPDSDARELSSFDRDLLGTFAEPSQDAAEMRDAMQALLDANFNLRSGTRAVHPLQHHSLQVSRTRAHARALASGRHLRLNLAVALRVRELAEN